MIRALTLALTLCPVLSMAQQATPTVPDVQIEVETEGPMTLARLAGIVKAIDADVVAQGPTLQFSIDDIPVIIVADAAADRMRAMIPIASAEGLSAEDLLRLMQANFDTALDAR
jgi:hypothetical protein